MKKKKIQVKILDILILFALAGIGIYIAYRMKVVLHYKWNWHIIPQYMFRFNEEAGKWVPNMLLEGLFTTIRLSIWGTILAAFFGTLMGLFRISKSLFYRLIGRSYVEFIRNMPPLVLILIFYFFVSDQIMPLLGVDDFILSCSEDTRQLVKIFFAPPAYFSAFISAVISLALFEGAYITEIVRSGIQSVEKGQWEAASALGFTRLQRMRYVVLPQAIQRILPPLAGQFISLIKDSSIVSVISIQELTFQGLELMASTYLTFEIWITIALLYLIITLSCSVAVSRLEVRMGRHCA